MATTTEGKAVSARNATTHGLFCRQTVLPHLGESADAYKALLETLFVELPPRNLMDRQYLELWAEASWKLRRLSRWEAQMWESDALDEDALLTKLERLTRLQATLRRQLDRAVKMLQKDVADLYAERLRREILTDLSMTEHDCRRDKHCASIASKMLRGERETQMEEAEERLAALDLGALDNAAPVTPENCQNELPREMGGDENCQNEPPPAAPNNGGASSAEASGGPLPLRSITTFTFRQAAPPSPAAALRRFARACAERT